MSYPKPMTTDYSIQTAYEWGQYYRDQRLYPQAELCISLLLVKDNDINMEAFKSGQINQTRLTELRQLLLTIQQNVDMPSQGGVPLTSHPEILKLVSSFYRPMLISKIKPGMKTRSIKQIRTKTMAVHILFNEITKKHGNVQFNLEQYKSEFIRSNNDKINEWSGPDFGHIRYDDNKKNYNQRKSLPTKITIVNSYKGYRKRCHNSQETWFRKYYAIFYAQCLTHCKQIFGNGNVRFISVSLVKAMVEAKIKFDSTKPTDLISNSTLLIPGLQDAFLAIHELFDLKQCIQITQHFTGKEKGKKMREELLRVIKNVYLDLLNQGNTEIFDFESLANNVIIDEKEMDRMVNINHEEKVKEDVHESDACFAQFTMDENDENEANIDLYGIGNVHQQQLHDEYQYGVNDNNQPSTSLEYPQWSRSSQSVTTCTDTTYYAGNNFNHIQIDEMDADLIDNSHQSLVMNQFIFDHDIDDNVNNIVQQENQYIPSVISHSAQTSLSTNTLHIDDLSTLSSIQHQPQPVPHCIQEHGPIYDTNINQYPDHEFEQKTMYQPSTHRANNRPLCDINENRDHYNYNMNHPQQRVQNTFTVEPMMTNNTCIQPTPNPSFTMYNNNNNNNGSSSTTNLVCNRLPAPKIVQNNNINHMHPNICKNLPLPPSPPIINTATNSNHRFHHNSGSQQVWNNTSMGNNVNVNNNGTQYIPSLACYNDVQRKNNHLCTSCGCPECVCDLQSINNEHIQMDARFNNVNDDNDTRSFQSTNHFLNPSQPRIHQKYSHQNNDCSDRNQRRLNHINYLSSMRMRLHYS